jgi:hypothetical protein
LDEIAELDLYQFVRLSPSRNALDLWHLDPVADCWAKQNVRTRRDYRADHDCGFRSRLGFVRRLGGQFNVTQETPADLPDRAERTGALSKRSDRLGKHRVAHALPAGKCTFRSYPRRFCLRVRRSCPRLQGTDRSRVRSSRTHDFPTASRLREITARRLRPRRLPNISNPSSKPVERTAGAKSIPVSGFFNSSWY